MNKKRLSLIAAIIIMITAAGSAAELSETAKTYQLNAPAVFNAVRIRAVAEWSPDHSMVIWEINNQFEAFDKLGSLFDADARIVMTAIAEWTTGGWATIEQLTEENRPFEGPTDWVMVVWEAERQIASALAYQ